MIFSDTWSVWTSKFTRTPHIPVHFIDYSAGLRVRLHVPSNCFTVISSALLTVPPLTAHVYKLWGLFHPSSLGYWGPVSCHFREMGQEHRKLRSHWASLLQNPCARTAPTDAAENPPWRRGWGLVRLWCRITLFWETALPQTSGVLQQRSERKFPCCCPQLCPSASKCNIPLRWEPSPAPHCSPHSSHPLANNPMDKKGRFYFVVVLLTLL